MDSLATTGLGEKKGERERKEKKEKDGKGGERNKRMESCSGMKFFSRPAFTLVN